MLKLDFVKDWYIRVVYSVCHRMKLCWIGLISFFISKCASNKSVCMVRHTKSVVSWSSLSLSAPGNE